MYKLERQRIGGQKTRTIWQSLVLMTELIPALSLTSEGTSEASAWLLQPTPAPLSNHRRPSCQEEREEMHIRSWNWLCVPFFCHGAELSHESGSTVEEEP